MYLGSRLRQVYNVIMSLRIVIADDAPFIHEVLNNLLSLEGMMVVGNAFDGAEAVQIACQEKPDLILMDAVMPKKNGLQATREILKKLPDAKIIACSTVTDERIIHQSIEAGCSNFIAKPFSGQELVEMIKRTAGSTNLWAKEG